MTEMFDNVHMPAAASLAYFDAEMFVKMFDICRAHRHNMTVDDATAGERSMWFFDDSTGNVHSDVSECLSEVFSRFQNFCDYAVKDSVDECPLFSAVDDVLGKANCLLSTNVRRRFQARDTALESVRDEYEALLASYFSMCHTFSDVSESVVENLLDDYFTCKHDEHVRRQNAREFRLCAHFIPLALHAHWSDASSDGHDVLPEKTPLIVASAMHKCEANAFSTALRNDSVHADDELLKTLLERIRHVARAYDKHFERDATPLKHWLDTVNAYDSAAYKQRARILVAPWKHNYNRFLERIEALHQLNVVEDDDDAGVPCAADSCASHCAWSPKYSNGALRPDATYPSPSFAIESPPSVMARETPCSRGARYLMEMSEGDKDGHSSAAAAAAAPATDDLQESDEDGNSGGSADAGDALNETLKHVIDPTIVDQAFQFGVITSRPTDCSSLATSVLNKSVHTVQSIDISKKVRKQGYNFVRYTKYWILRNCDNRLQYLPLCIVGRREKQNSMRAVCIYSSGRVSKVSSLKLVPKFARYHAQTPRSPARRKREAPSPTFFASAPGRPTRICAIPTCNRRAPTSCDNAACPLKGRRDVGVCDHHKVSCELGMSNCRAGGCHYCYYRYRDRQFHCRGCWSIARGVDKHMKREEIGSIVNALNNAGDATCCPNTECLYSGKDERGKLSTFKTLRSELRECAACGETKTCTACSGVVTDTDSGTSAYYCSEECFPNPSSKRRRT